MGLLSKLFHHPDPIIIPTPASSGLRLPYVYACTSCETVQEGLTNGKCKSCRSRAVYHVRTLIINEQHRAAQRSKIAETIKAARIKNDLAVLTAPELPPKEAA